MSDYKTRWLEANMYGKELIVDELIERIASLERELAECKLEHKTVTTLGGAHPAE